MAVTPADLIAPKGEIEPELFPGEEESKDLETRLQEYVRQGVAKIVGLTFDPTSKADDATRNWAYYLAFRQAYTLALARPAEDDTGVEVLGNTVFTKDQREGLKEMREMYLAEFQALIVDTGAGPSAASMGVPSHSVTNTFDW